MGWMGVGSKVSSCPDGDEGIEDPARVLRGKVGTLEGQTSKEIFKRL